MVWMVLKKEVALSQAHGRCFFFFSSFIKGIKKLFWEYNKLCPNMGCQDQAGIFTAASWALASCLQSHSWWLWQTSAHGSVKDTTLERSLSRAGTKMVLAKLLRCKINRWSNLGGDKLYYDMPICEVRRLFHKQKGIKGKKKKLIPREFPNLQNEGWCFQSTLQVWHHRPGLLGCAWGLGWSLSSKQSDLPEM